MKLDFHFLQHDGILEARVDGGYYHISEINKFIVYGYINKDCFSLGEYVDIYEALKAANDHFNKEEYFRTGGMECKAGQIKKSVSERMDQLIDMYEKGAITKSTLIVMMDEFYCGIV